MSAPQEEPVGSLAEEAARLMHALKDWAEDRGGEYAGATAAAAAGAADAAHQWREHVADGGTECTLCPVCRVIAAVRGTSPEVRQHLSAAASSLMQAAAGMMATEVPETAPRRAGTPTQKIDLDVDDWEDD